MTPRPYQSEALAAIAASFAGSVPGKSLAVLPTGAGKTIIFAWEAQRRVGLCQRTLILAHREELIEQAADKICSAIGIVADIEKAERRADLGSPIIVASVQTMLSRGERWPADHFGLVVCDEAHHAISDSWQKVLARFDKTADVLGVTASPDRGDKRSLGEYFERVAVEVPLFDLIHAGYLSRISVKSIPLSIDLNAVKQVAGDFDVGALGETLRPYLRSIAKAIVGHASFRKVLAFLPLIATSKEFASICREEGLSAAHIDGYSEDRAGALARFDAGEFDLLSNAMLLTEGYDCPTIDCVVILRPTRSRPLYAQMVGRGTRCADSKENLLLLDFLWLHERHNLIRPAHLVAKSDEEAKAITELSSSGGGERDIEDLDREAQSGREEALRAALASKKGKKGKLVDAMEWCLGHGGSPGLWDYQPTMRWESEAVSDKQAWLIKRNGIDPKTVSGRGHASKLIDLIKRSTPPQMASEGQKAMMRRLGVQHWATATADDARKFFAGLRGKR